MARESPHREAMLGRLFLQQRLFVYYMLGLVLAAGGVLSPYFFNMINLTNVLRQTVPMTFLSLGQLLVFIGGGADLSIGAVASMAQCVTAGVMAGKPENVVPALLLTYGVALAVGLVNGLVIVHRRAAPFIVTLGMASIVKGLVLAYTGGFHVGSITEGFRRFAWTEIGRFPVPVVYIVVAVCLTAVALKKTRFGRYIYAIGGNEESARLSGINTAAVKITSYLLCSLTAATAGVFLASRMGVGDPLVGEPLVLDCIACLVIGGTSMRGGKGTVEGTMAGVLLIALVSNLLNLMDVSSFVQLVIKGVIIISAVATYELIGGRKR